MYIEHLRILFRYIGITTIALLAVYGLLTLGYLAYGSGSIVETAISAKPVTAHAASDQTALTEVPLLQGASATVPLLISYEGYLTNNENRPVNDTYTMTFRIYATETAPIEQALWTEIQPGIEVREGFFRALLGSNEPLPPNLFDLPNRVIGVTISSGQQLASREFLSVPYAVHADYASGLRGFDGTNIGIKTSYGVLTIGPAVENWSQFGTDRDRFYFGKGIVVDTGIIGSLGQDLHLRTDESNGGTSQMVIKTSGEVGIGIDDPSAKLHVNGNLRVDGTIINDSFQQLQTQLQSLENETNHLSVAIPNHYHPAPTPEVEEPECPHGGHMCDDGKCYPPGKFCPHIPGGDH